jgi:LDH2 family malate/lactate/ureidoglycolate dehydrogenase
VTATALVPPAVLAAHVTRLFTAAGLPAADAAACAAQTVDAELRGVASHGCVRLRVFVDRLRRGTVNPTPAVRIVTDLPAYALLDGDRGMSAIGGTRAMEHAMAKAAASGIGAAGVRRVSHTGHVGWFARMALARNMIAIVASSATPNMAPSGGAERLVGNNPIAFAVPSAGEAPVVFDMATSKVARGWVLLAAKSGTPIPPDWALDAEGRPTTDARRAVDGTLLPVGDHKGFGLALVLGLLTDVLTGNVPEAERPDWLVTDREFLLSMLCIAIDPDACLGAPFAAGVRDAVDRLKASRLADDADAVRIPGEAGVVREREAQDRGIPLAPALVADLRDLAATLGVAPLDVAL